MAQVPKNISYYLMNPSAPITLNSSFVMQWVPLYWANYFIQVVVTGTPSGNFYLNASGDSPASGSSIIPPKDAPFYVAPSLANPVNTSLVAGSTYNMIAPGINAWNVNGANYTFVQIGYTDSSGGTSTAQLTFANITQKGLS
jgi:hypothetical protein